MIFNDKYSFLCHVIFQTSPAKIMNGDGINGVDIKKDKEGGSGDKDMTSKDYYFDSYAHFGIHEVCCTNLFQPNSLLIHMWVIIKIKIGLYTTIEMICDSQKLIFLL